MHGALSVTDCKEVFDLFDFWDGRDGLVDAAKVGDFLRCLGLNPTEEQVQKNGGCQKMGELSSHAILTAGTNCNLSQQEKCTSVSAL